jgi:hypothetical protein
VQIIRKTSIVARTGEAFRALLQTVRTGVIPALVSGAWTKCAEIVAAGFKSERSGAAIVALVGLQADSARTLRGG